MGAKNGQQDFNGSRGRALATCVLHALVVAALAATREDLDAALDHKEVAVRDFKASLESAARDINDAFSITRRARYPRAAPSCVTVLPL